MHRAAVIPVTFTCLLRGSCRLLPVHTCCPRWFTGYRVQLRAYATDGSTHTVAHAVDNISGLILPVTHAARLRSTFPSPHGRTWFVTRTAAAVFTTCCLVNGTRTVRTRVLQFAHGYTFPGSYSPATTTPGYRFCQHRLPVRLRYHIRFTLTHVWIAVLTPFGVPACATATLPPCLRPYRAHSSCLAHRTRLPHVAYTAVLPLSFCRSHLHRLPALGSRFGFSCYWFTALYSRSRFTARTHGSAHAVHPVLLDTPSTTAPAVPTRSRTHAVWLRITHIPGLRWLLDSAGSAAVHVAATLLRTHTRLPPFAVCVGYTLLVGLLRCRLLVRTVLQLVRGWILLVIHTWVYVLRLVTHTIHTLVVHVATYVTHTFVCVYHLRVPYHSCRLPHRVCSHGSPLPFAVITGCRACYVLHAPRYCVTVLPHTLPRFYAHYAAFAGCAYRTRVACLLVAPAILPVTTLHCRSWFTHCAFAVYAHCAGWFSSPVRLRFTVLRHTIPQLHWLVHATVTFRFCAFAIYAFAWVGLVPVRCGFRSHIGLHRLLQFRFTTAAAFCRFALPRAVATHAVGYAFTYVYPFTYTRTTYRLPSACRLFITVHHVVPRLPGLGHLPAIPVRVGYRFCRLPFTHICWFTCRTPHAVHLLPHTCRSILGYTFAAPGYRRTA